MDIFKRGDKVWFEYEISGHPYERCGFILDGPSDNGFYRIKTANSAIDFCIHKDKIHYERPDKRIKEDNKMKKRNRNIIKTEKYQRTIKDITFNGPAVIVKFEPTGGDSVLGRPKGDKVVVVCKDGDKYDMKTGFLLAILKEFMNNQSYGNILEKLDSFDTFDIPQVGKFKVGDIVRLKTGTKKYKVIGQDTINDIKRYRLLSYNSNSNYTFYERENRLILADEVYRK